MGYFYEEKSMNYREKKSSLLKKALKSQNVNVVNTPKVELVAKPVQKSKPVIHLSTDELAEIKDWEVGKTYELELTVKMVSKKEGREYEFDEESSDSTVRASFSVLSAETEESNNAVQE